jgi:hypothetical protein
MAGATGSAGEIRDLQQEIYLLDLVLSLYRVYIRRLRDAEGRRLIETYVRAEEDRSKRIERHLLGRGAIPAAAIRRSFTLAGDLYGRASSWLGTRVMLRMTLSASRRASRRACSLLDASSQPELRYLATLRAKNEGGLLDPLRQHLIDTAKRG